MVVFYSYNERYGIHCKLDGSTPGKTDHTPWLCLKIVQPTVPPKKQLKVDNHVPEDTSRSWHLLFYSHFPDVFPLIFAYLGFSLWISHCIFGRSITNHPLGYRWRLRKTPHLPVTVVVPLEASRDHVVTSQVEREEREEWAPELGWWFERWRAKPKKCRKGASHIKFIHFGWFDIKLRFK